jgi:acetyl/propionyl-CoA carboxylase alpha subunit
VTSVAVYSTVDADAPFVQLADESVHIGPAAPKLSYLYVPILIHSAINHDVDAIHPGYGFLSEDPYFAEVCAENGTTFIGIRFLPAFDRAGHARAIGPAYRARRGSVVRVVGRPRRI